MQTRPSLARYLGIRVMGARGAKACATLCGWYGDPGLSVDGSLARRDVMDLLLNLARYGGSMRSDK